MACLAVLLFLFRRSRMLRLREAGVDIEGPWRNATSTLLIPVTDPGGKKICNRRASFRRLLRKDREMESSDPHPATARYGGAHVAALRAILNAVQSGGIT